MQRTNSMSNPQLKRITTMVVNFWPLDLLLQSNIMLILWCILQGIYKLSLHYTQCLHISTVMMKGQIQWAMYKMNLYIYRLIIAYKRKGLGGPLIILWYVASPSSSLAMKDSLHQNFHLKCEQQMPSRTKIAESPLLFAECTELQI